jgi:hypothetical protein
MMILGETTDEVGPLDFLLQSPIFWSTSIMLSIVALLYTWEEAVIEARERLPPALMPVVDKMLAEMGGLGFIGLFLGVVVTDGPLGAMVGDISEHFLGDEEILLESFEFLHTAFFEVATLFFVIAGLTVATVINKINKLQAVSKAIFDRDQDGKVSLEELADILRVDSLQVDLDKDGPVSPEEIEQALRTAQKDTLWEEITMSTRQIKAEALVVRERFIETCRVSPNFRIETYFTRIFGKNLEEIVELSPLTWLPLIPAISLGRSVDMSRDIVSASSPNAYESCGYFLGSPSFFGVSTAIFAAALVWGCFNFWKVTQIKEMLIPALVRDSNCNNKATLLPPRFEDEKLLNEFNSSPSIFGWIEGMLGEPPRNDQEKLFGAAGAAGPDLYRDSIKFHTWLVVSQIVFWGSQIVARDANALVRGMEVGNPDLVVPELAIFGFYVALAIAQLWLAPQTFLNYSLITSIEDLANEFAIQESCQLDGASEFDLVGRSRETE